MHIEVRKDAGLSDFASHEFLLCLLATRRCAPTASAVCCLRRTGASLTTRQLMYSRRFLVLAVSLTAEQVPGISRSPAPSLFVAAPTSLMSPSPRRLTVAGRYVKRRRPMMRAYSVVAVSLLYASAHPHRFCHKTTSLTYQKPRKKKTTQ